MKFIDEVFGNVRGVYLDGQAWLYATDVCKALELKDVTSAMRALKDDEKMTVCRAVTRKNDSAECAESKKRGGARQYVLVNESGLYRLIFTSRKPKAEDFQRWIFHEVLPTLRREGEYQMIWQEARDGGKDTRRNLTDTVKNFCEYLQARGELDRPPGTWFIIFTKLVNKTCGVEDERDKLSPKQLFEPETCENICAKEISAGMNSGKSHQEIYETCKEKLAAWQDLTK